MKPHSSHGNKPSWVASSGQPSVFANSSHKSYSSSHKYPSKQTQYGCFPNNYGNGGCYPSGGWNNGGYGGCYPSGGCWQYPSGGYGNYPCDDYWPTNACDSGYGGSGGYGGFGGSSYGGNGGYGVPFFKR